MHAIDADEQHTLDVIAVSSIIILGVGWSGGSGQRSGAGQ
jgi:hypothetical protein